MNLTWRYMCILLVLCYCDLYFETSHHLHICTEGIHDRVLSMPLTGLDKNLNPCSLAFGEALNFCLPWARFALLGFDLVGR